MTFKGTEISVAKSKANKSGKGAGRKRRGGGDGVGVMPKVRKSAASANGSQNTADIVRSIEALKDAISVLGADGTKKVIDTLAK